MKGLLAFLLLFFGTSEGSLAQHLSWSLPTASNSNVNSSYYNFTTNPNTLTDLPTKPNIQEGYDGSKANYAHNAYYGVNGHLEFFVVDNRIYNSMGYPIEIGPYGQGGNTIMGEPLKHSPEDANNPAFLEGKVIDESEWVIVPVPGKCERFYLFAISGNEDALGKLSMVELDMGASNPNYPGYGKIVPVTFNNFPPHYEGKVIYFDPEGDPNNENCQNYHLAASPKLPSGNRILFMNTCNKLKTFKITSSGIVDQFSTPTGYNDHSITSNFPDFSANGAQTGYESEMELIEKNPGEFRIAFPFRLDYNGSNSNINDPVLGVHVIDMDGSGNVTERFFDLPDLGLSTKPNGSELTPDGERFYVSTSAAGMGYLESDISTYGANTVQNDTGVMKYLENTNGNVSPSEASDARNGMIETGRDGKMYFAADGTIYYLNNPNNPSGSNLNTIPGGPVPIPSGDHGVRPLPDQIDTEDPTSLFNRSCACCEAYKDYDFMTYTQNSNTTWSPGSNPWGSSVVRVQDKLVIDATLTIENMTFRFAPGAEVDVKQGAHLIMRDQTVFTSTECECTMWEGVDILGDPFSPYYDPNAQGSLQMSENSMIEYAKIGAQSAFQGQFLTLGGGWINARNSRFKDNLIDVQEYGVFQNKTNSNFYNTRFFTTADLKDNFGKTPDIHMELLGIEKLDITGCTFINEAPSTYDHPLERGNGIEAVNSEFDVLEDCQQFGLSRCPYSSNKDPNVFKRLAYGVKAISSYATRNVQVEGNRFIENWRGVYFEGTDMSSVQANVFEVGKHVSVGGNSVSDYEKTAPYGIYSQTNTRYAISGNRVQTYHHLNAPEAGGFGIVVDNSNTGSADEIPHMVYRNDVQLMNVPGSFLIGINATRDNDGNDQQSETGDIGNGLEFRCNRFDQPQASYGDIVKTSGVISNPQGDCYNPNGVPSNQFGTPVDNRFTDHDQVWHFYQQEWQINQLNVSYEFRSTGSSPDLTLPRERDPYVNKQNCTQNGPASFHNFSQHCPRRELAETSGGWGPIPVITTFQEMRTKTDSLKGLIDAGDTQGLLDTIAGLGRGRFGNSPGQVKQALLNASPYLSDTVLKAAIGSDLPPGILKEVLIANSPLTEEVYQRLQAENGIPPGIIQEIDQHQSGESEREALWEQVDGLIKEAKRKETRMLQHYSHKDTSNTMDSMIAYLESTMHPWNNQLLIDAYLDQGKISQAEQLVDSLIAASGSNTPLYLQVKKKTIELLKHDQAACEEIAHDSVVRQEVEQMAHADAGNSTRKRRGCSNAQALLHRYNEFEATEYFDHFQRAGNKSANGSGRNGKGKPDEKGPEDLRFKVWPNPSDGSFVVEHELSEGKLALYDMQGRLVKERRLEAEGRIRLNLESADQGLYFLRLSQDGRTVHHQKLVLRP